jgi:hypothetical protein
MPDKTTPHQSHSEPPSHAEPLPESVVDPGDGHIGATEDEVSDTPAPAGEAYEDEPKQG